jgi:signal transduction histidine kinase
MLERRVAERTAALTVANRELQAEVAERTRAEAQILAYQGRLQSLAAELSASEERQRRQIAAALHDAIGHRLAVAVIMLRGLLEDGVDGHAPQVTRACELVEESIGHTRSLTLQLSPPILYELGLEPALEWLAEQVRAESGLAVEVDGDGQVDPAGEEARALVFNCVRELLVNVVKHARARTARVTLTRQGRYARVTVADDGVGCDGAKAQSVASSSGFGLFNVRERLAHLGGSFDLVSGPGNGCHVTLVAPLGVGADGGEGSTSK